MAELVGDSIQVQYGIMQIAYLRRYESKNYDIRFIINLETENEDSTEKSVTGFAKYQDTLAQLKNSIQNTIFEFNADKENVSINLPSTPDGIEVIFLNGDKPYKDSILCENFFKLENKSLRVLGQEFPIITNAPLVRSIRLPSAVCADFEVEPLEFKIFNTSTKASEFVWYRSKDKVEWEKIWGKYSYKVKKDDIGYFLKIKCQPISAHGVKGPSMEAVSDFPVDHLASLPRCPFEDRHSFTRERLNGNRLRVVSYNTLADKYVDGKKFMYCPPFAQVIHYRKQLILKEIEGYNADIVCLQEVDVSQFKSYFEKKFQPIQLRCFYNRKGDCLSEGLLIAFDIKRFEYLKYRHIILRKVVGRNPYKKVAQLLDQNPEVAKEFFKQHTSIQTLILRDKFTSRYLIVANTHLYYRPEADHIRLLQAFMITIHLTNLRYEVMNSYHSNNVGIIFCGDFNSDLSRSLYGFMTRGTIDPMHKDCLLIAPNGNASINHKLCLINASGTPKYTNYTDEYKGLLDYIFVERRKFSVKRVIPVPSEEELQQYEGLPNAVYPSDHVSLVVDLEYKTKRR